MRASSEHGILVTGSYSDVDHSCVPIIRFSCSDKAGCLSIESDRIRMRSAHTLWYPREKKPRTITGTHDRADVLLWCTSVPAGQLRDQLRWILSECNASSGSL